MKPSTLYFRLSAFFGLSSYVHGMLRSFFLPRHDWLSNVSWAAGGVWLVCLVVALCNYYEECLNERGKR